MNNNKDPLTDWDENTNSWMIGLYLVLGTLAVALGVWIVAWLISLVMF